MKNLLLVIVCFANIVHAQSTEYTNISKLKGNVHYTIDCHYNNSNYIKNANSFYEKDTTWYKNGQMVELHSHQTQYGDIRTISRYNEKEFITEVINYNGTDEETKEIYIYDNNNNLITDSLIGIKPKFKRITTYNIGNDNKATTISYDEYDQLEDGKPHSVIDNDGNTVTTTTIIGPDSVITIDGMFKPGSNEFSDTTKYASDGGDSIAVIPSSYKYDAKRNLIEVKYKAGETFTQKFENYDEKRNWRFTKTYDQKGKIFEVIKREIVYY